MTTSTDLKPGDAVQHPEKGNGVYVIAVARRVPQIFHATTDGFPMNTVDLIGWERVETCTADERRTLDYFHDVREGRCPFRLVGRVVLMDGGNPENEIVQPGHVQVKVDDLDAQTLSEWSQWAACNVEDEALVRIGRAFVARQVELGDPQSSPVVELPVKLSHPEPTERGAKATFTFYDGDKALHLVRVWEGERAVWHDQFSLRYLWDELTDMDGVEGSLTLGWDD